MESHKSDKTERPTAKRKRDARERGQVTRSRDMASALSLIGIVLLLGWAGSTGLARVTRRLELAFGDVATQGTMDFDIGPVARLIASDVWLMFQVIGPLLLAGAAVSIAASVVQTGGVFATKALKLHWNKLSPKQGFAKFAPLQAGGELVKAIIGVAAVGTLCYLFVRPMIDAAPSYALMEPMTAARFGWERVSTLMFRAGLLLFVLAIGDYALQFSRIRNQLKMTKKEVKDDLKAEEGNPQTKARIRRIQREMARKRMMQAVKTATVVVTNPTHVAVALQYDRAEMRAPVVVAKGHDDVAARIREIARAHDVPLVENVALARALDAGADVGDVIPADLFGAVAEVLAYLVKMKQLAL